MDIKTVRGYDLTEYLPVFLHYQLSNLRLIKEKYFSGLDGDMGLI